MLKLDFEILYDSIDYNNCWICSSILCNIQIFGTYFITCDRCKYILRFDYWENISRLIYIEYNNININSFHNKLNIKFPINLDKCLNTINKLQILL